MNASGMKMGKWIFWFGWVILTLALPAQSVVITGDSAINQCETKNYTIGILNNSGNPITNLVITARLVNLIGFSYATGSTAIDVNSGAPFCTVDPTPSGTNRIWDIDASCPGSPFTLADGQTLNITFSLATDCTAVSGSLNTRIDYEIGGTPLFDETGAHSIQVLPGGVTIKKTPNVIPQYIGQHVTWTLTVENTGYGIIENVVVTDVLGAGLSYVSASPAGNNSGQTTTWGTADIPALASMAPGDAVTIDLTAVVTACDNLDNTADARWGCDLVTPCYDTATTIPPSTATASVQRLPRTPLLEYTPPDISFTYCQDYADVSFVITNVGDGAAYSPWILVDLTAFTLSNLSAGAVYNPTDRRFELANPIPPGGTYTLGFRLNFSTWCGTVFPSGQLLWQSLYLDECANEFYPPVKLSAIAPPSGSTSLAMTKVGGGEAIQIGDQVGYTITSAYSGPLSCGSGGSVSDITVVDTIPAGFTVVDAGGGTWVPGGGGTGGTITWTYTPPATLNTSITLQAPDRSQCETYCFTTFTNSATASGTDCCGCPLSTSASQSSAIECEEQVDSEKTVTPTPGIRCNELTYTNTYTFTPGASVNLQNLEFDDHAENQQRYVSGSLVVTLDGGPVSGYTVTDNTPGGILLVNFSGSPSTPMANRILVISYRMQITEATISACADGSFLSWSSLDLGSNVGNECIQDGHIHETTTVSVQAPAMTVGISGLGQIVDKCQTHTITLTLTQTSAVADPKDVRLVLSGLNYYVVDPAATTCSGSVAPTSCTPAMVGNDYVWYFADGFTGSGQNAVIQLDVRKRCTGIGDLTAIGYFDDNCTDDGNYDDTCSVTAIEHPLILRSGDLLVEKTPEVYYATSNTVEWKIYVTNRGNGTAFFTWVDDVLGAGLDYVSAVVDDMTGVTVTADQNHSGTAINGCTIAISDLTPGERREITFTALLIDCDNLTNDVTASWGCGGLECQTPVSDSATVQIPRPLLLNTNVVTTPADACSDPQGYITLRNAGQTTCYNLQITETLPAGLTYIPGTTRWRKNGGAWNGPNAAFDPNPTVSPLVWTSSQISGLSVANPGDTIEIQYDLHANCPFTGGNVTLSTRYENPCGQVFANADSVFTVAFRAPQVTVTKTRVNEPIDCGELVEWTITVQNTSGYTLPIIWIEDTLDAAFTYSSSVGDPPYTSDNGTFNGVNTVSWELRNVDHNDTVTLTLRATTDTAPCSPNLDNTVLAWWGCGAADGSSGTKPGVDPPDNTLCLTTTSVSTVRTETREPSVGFLDIALNPTSIDSCDDSTELTVTIENTGPTDASNVDMVITLPAGITYINGSSAVTCGGMLSDPAADPVVSGNQLIYYNIGNTGSNLCNLVQASGGNDTVTLVFSIRSNCYITSTVGFQLYYYDCCGDRQYNTTASETLTALYPQLTVTKTPASAQVDCAADQEWVITVTNTGTGNAQVVRIEDTLGAWIDYISSTPAATSLGGQVYGWEINNLAASGGSASFTITGRLNPDGLPNQADCAALLRQNNVRAIWGCGTSGDAVDGNPNTTGYDCTTGTWTNAPAAILRMPDLIATAITPTVSCTSDGTFSGTVTVTVRNQGDGAALGGFQYTVADGTGWSVTGNHGGDIAAGASVVIPVDVSAWNPDCSPCTYSFTASVDTADTICECREDNNNFGPQAYSPPIADLQVEADTLAVSCIADGQYRISGTVTLRNAGCAGTLTQNVPMRFTLHAGSGCSGAQVAQWTHTFTGVSIAAGATQVFTIPNYDITGNACTSASGCGFSIRMEADYSNTICECDGTDNTRCSDKTFTIPDLRVVSDTLAISCSVDGQIRIQGNLVIANDGCGGNLAFNIPIRLRVYNDDDTCSGTNGNLTFNQAGVNIPAGGTQTFAINRTLNRNLCVNSTGCQVALGVELDYTLAICECDGTNNNYCVPNKDVSIPDLQVTGDTLAVTCLQDGQVRVSGTATIANTGCNAAVTGNLPVRFTLFSNINCGGVQVAQWTETFAGANIAAGGNQVFTITNRDIITNICTNSTGCQLSLRIEADPGAVICECNGGNNTRCSNKTVSVTDLRITAVTPLITCTSDGNLTGTVQVTVNNNGCGAANNIPVRLSSDCGYPFSDQTIGALAAGASTTLTFNFTPDISRCTCTFTATVDPDNVVCECNGTNNSLAAAPYTSPIPDLTITDIDFSNVTCLNDNISGSVGVTVQNSGCGTASNIPVALTSDGCLSFGNQTIVSLGAGASTTVTFTISGSWADCTAENCQFTATVDPANAICEYNGGNNTLSETYTTTLPDLVVSDIDFSGISCAGDTISDSVTVTVQNQGFGTAANFQVSLTSDGCLSFSNQTVAGPLAAGASTTVTFPVSGSWADCTDCTCAFTARVDPSNSVCECNGANNTRSEDYTQTLPDLRINSVTPAMSCIADGNLTGSVIVNVSNIGCGAANNASVRLASDCGITFSDQTVTLAPGASADLTFTYTPNCSACTCVFTATIDPGNTICECNGANNSQSSLPFTMTVPDITVQSDTLAIACSGGSQVQISGNVTLANNGCGANLSANIPIRFTLYDNTGCSGNIIDQWTQTFTGVNMASAGGTQVFAMIPRTVSSNLCLNSTGCLGSIRIEADYTGSICECDGTNNTGCADNQPVDIPDIEVAADTLGASCLSDGQVTVSGTVTLANAGCGANLTNNVPMRFTLYDNTGCSGNVLSQWTQTFSGVNIPASGGTQAFTITPQNLTADLVANSTGCQVSIRVEADYTNSICECDDTDNTWCADNKAIDIPDIEVSGDTLAVSCLADGQARVSGTVTLLNNGCGSNLAANVPMRFTLYDNTNCSGSVISQWTETLAGVNITAGGGTQAFTINDHNLTGNFCTLSTSCQLSIRIEADYTNAICESDGTDNTRCGDKTIAIPNLRVRAEDIVITCTSDGRLAISVTVFNTGCGPASGIVVDLSDNDGRSAQQTIANLAAGASTALTFANWISDGSPATLIFTATVDTGLTVCECDGSDNTALQTFTLPNLRTVSVVPECQNDTLYRVRVTLENNGSSAINTDFDIRLVDDDGHTVTAAFTTLGGTLPFAVGTQQTVTFANWTVDCNPTTLNFTASADSGLVICESNEADNDAGTSFIINDLRLDSITPLSVCTADGIISGTIAVALTNRGGQPINNDFEITVDDGQGWNSVLRYNADLGGTLPLAPGASATVTVDWTRSFTASPYTCTFPAITVTLDSSGVLCECSSANNTAGTSYTLPHPDLTAPSMTVSCLSDGILQLQITVGNAGCSDLTDDFSLTIQDSTGASRTVTYTSLGGTLPLAAGASQILTISDWAFTCAAASLDFTVQLDVTGVICELDGSNNSLTYTYPLTSPDLQIQTITPVCSPAGTVTFTVVIANTGYGTATNAVLTVHDDIPALIHTATVTIPAGGTATVTFTSPPYSGDIDHTFRFVIDEGTGICECNGTNNEQSVTVNCPHLGMITRKQANPSLVNACGETEFTMSLQNVGQLNVYNVILTDILPNGLDYIPGSTRIIWPGGTSNADPVRSGNTLTWTTGATLYGGSPLGEELQIRFRAVAAACQYAAGDLVNTFRATAVDGSGTAVPAPGLDPEDNDPDDTSTAVVRLACPNLRAERTCPAIEFITLADLLEYRILITNSGDAGSELTGIEVRDDLPAGWSLDSFTSDGAAPVTSPAAAQQGTLTWNFGDFRLASGSSITLTIRLKPDAQACGREFRDEVRITATDTCRLTTYQSGVVACSPLVICGVPILEVEKVCPRAQIPGAPFRFELTIINRGDGDADNVAITDFLPEPFQYVPGSTLLDGEKFADPEGDRILTWKLGKMLKGTRHILTFMAIAPADTDPGTYCNEAQISGRAPDRTAVISPKIQCCTVLRRDASGCCILIVEEPVGSYRKPEVPIAFVDPYFRTRDGMFTAWAALRYFRQTDPPEGTTARFIRDRLRNYALSTVEEFYLRSGMGIKQSDGSLWLSYNGSYPRIVKGQWEEKDADKFMTPAQMAFELLALHEAASHQTDPNVQNRLRDIFRRKLDFLAADPGKLPEKWEFNNNKIEKSDKEANREDYSSLFFALQTLAKDKVVVPAALMEKIVRELPEAAGSFDGSFPREELLLTLGLLEAGDREAATSRMQALERYFEKENKGFATVEAYALAALAAHHLQGNLRDKFLTEMNRKFYLLQEGVYAVPQADQTHHINLSDTAALIYALAQVETGAGKPAHEILYRTLDEAGLFLNQRHLLVDSPPLNLIRNHSLSSIQEPIVSLIKTTKTVAPVFSEQAIFYTPAVPLPDHEVFPFQYAKFLAPGYETRTGRIARLSGHLQFLGNQLQQRPQRILTEEGRSLISAGESYVDVIFAAAAGLHVGGLLVLPGESLAGKSLSEASTSLESLEQKAEFSTATLADLMIAEKLYLAGNGRDKERIGRILAIQRRIVEALRRSGPIPDRFIAYLGRSTDEPLLSPLTGSADSITLAKLAYVMDGSGATAIPPQPEQKLKADDLAFLAYSGFDPAPFLPQIQAWVDTRKPADKQESSMAARSGIVLAHTLLKKPQDQPVKKLLELWDRESALPGSNRVENRESGWVVQYDPLELLLYLQALPESETFRYQRTLSLVTSLVESEWGIEEVRRYRPLPAAAYWLVRNRPKETVEPGDTLLIKVRVENRCPEGMASAGDLPSLFIRSEFFPTLIHTATQWVNGLDVLRPLLWKFADLVDGGILEYLYEVVIPKEFRDNFIDGRIHVRAYTGFQEFGPESASGDFCEDDHPMKRYPIQPPREIEGLVFEDLNVNGIRDPGEPGVPGVSIKESTGRLLGTDSEGKFLIRAGEELTGEQVELRSIPAGHVLSTAGTQLVNRYQQGIVAFGLVPCQTHRGIVFEDRNGNGRRDEGEPGLGGVVVRVRGKETVSSADGTFIFHNLPKTWKELIRVADTQPFVTVPAASLAITAE